MSLSARRGDAIECLFQVLVTGGIRHTKVAIKRKSTTRNHSDMGRSQQVRRKIRVSRNPHTFWRASPQQRVVVLYATANLDVVCIKVAMRIDLKSFTRS